MNGLHRQIFAATVGAISVGGELQLDVAQQHAESNFTPISLTHTTLEAPDLSKVPLNLILPHTASLADVALGIPALDGYPIRIGPQQTGQYSYYLAVQELQQMLIEKYHLPVGESGADGLFGSATLDAFWKALWLIGTPIPEHLELNQQTAQALIQSKPLHPKEPPIPIRAATLEDIAARQLDGSGRPIVLKEQPLETITFHQTVKKAQEILISASNSLLEDLEIEADGLFGWRTTAALKTYQSHHRLPITGELDATTATALIHDYPTRQELLLGEIIALTQRINLGPSSRLLLFEFALTLPPSSLESLCSAINSRSWESLNDNDQARFVEIILRTDYLSLSGLKLLLDRRHPKTGAPILLETNFDGLRTIDILHKLATNPLHPELERHKATILACVINELGDPFELNQGNRNTCSATTALFELYLYYPGIAAAIQLELFSHRGVLATHSGFILSRVPDSLEPILGSTRSPSERIMQAALMNTQFGYQYSDRLDRMIKLQTQIQFPAGQHIEQIANTLTNITGEPYVTFDCIDFTKAQLLEKLIAANQYGSICSIWWNYPNEDREARGILHAINFLAYDAYNDRIYFRNPQDPLNFRRGIELANPPRRIDWPERSIESMEGAEFCSRLERVCLNLAR